MSISSGVVRWDRQESFALRLATLLICVRRLKWQSTPNSRMAVSTLTSRVDLPLLRLPQRWSRPSIPPRSSSFFVVVVATMGGPEIPSPVPPRPPSSHPSKRRGGLYVDDFRSRCRDGRCRCRRTRLRRAKSSVVSRQTGGDVAHRPHGVKKRRPARPPIADRTDCPLLYLLVVRLLSSLV